MSHYEVVIGRCKSLEQLLVKRYRASGRGLHEKVSSVEAKLPPAIVRKLRFVATVRNKLVHESEGNTIDDLPGFERACDACEAALRPKGKAAATRRWPMFVGGLVTVALTVVAAWWLRGPVQAYWAVAAAVLLVLAVVAALVAGRRAKRGTKKRR